MNYQILNVAGMGLAFLSLFGLAEYLYHFQNWGVEKTRKLTHIGSGLIAMLFPLLFDSIWIVSLLSLSFLGILVLSKHYKLLPSINAVERKTTGSFWFPIAVILCFAAYLQFDNRAFYYLPLLTLSFADPMACLVGKKLPMHIFQFKESQKSIGGSLAFLIVGFVLGTVLLDEGFQIGLLTPLYISLLATTAEFFGGKGYDNILIPIACIAAMYFLQTPNLIYA